MDKLASLISPLTGKPGVKVFDKILSQDIINVYNRDGNILVDHYFKGIPEVYVMECLTTGYKFYYPETLTGGGDLYNEFHQTDPQKSDLYRVEGYDFDFAYELISEGQKILDIGCGTGEFLKKIKSKTENIYGLELNDRGCELSRKAGIKVFQETIQGHSKNNIEAYDVVCFFQVLEHIYDVRSFIESAVKVLKKGGRLIIGVPNNEPYIRRFDKYNTYNLPPHHMGLWNRKSLESLQELFGISINDISYNEKISRWDIDAYLRARMWLNIKTEYHQHSFKEKLAMGLLAPFAAPLSLFKHITSQINGSFIVADYIKK